MKIAKIDIYRLDIDYTRPIRTPIGTLSASRNVAVKLTADGGETGWGEASPFAPITGDSQDTTFLAAQAIARLIKGKDPLAIEARMREINATSAAQPSVRCAFDMALYDLLAKVAGLPLWALLGGEPGELCTDVTIGMQESMDEALGLVKAALAAGYQAVKLKVGRPDATDVDYVCAVRELVGSDIVLRIDANQGWTFPQALRVLKAMESLQIQFVEQPLAAWDHANLLRLREKIDIPLCADESVFDHHDALKLINSGAVDYLNIKLGKAGGIHTALKINAIAEAAGCRCMIGCFTESRLALTAAAHLALARPNICYLDLDSALSQTTDPVLGGMTYDGTRGGVIRVPDTPGHGAAFDERVFGAQHRVSI
jgi:o-succinylbenzoate synthase